MIESSLNQYQVTAKLGAGGMGEVFRARDTRLNREVAIKVLPESFAQDKERLARFEREAKALAALNHPNVAAIYGLERIGSSQALILELVEGEDLSARLKRGPLPVEEAMDVCKQIAEALEAAHEKGIIHRDLKPGNVKLTADGKVKVLDFGLAKTTTAEATSMDPDSPTITADYTMPGTLLGTAGYMSPEQARGKPVDKRSDIWSFGVVLYECLTGRRLFSGETVTDSIGALLHKEIDWSQLPKDTPPTIQLLLRKCLVRDRKRRLQDIGDARIELEQAIADPSSSLIRLSEGALQETKAGRGMPLKKVAGLVLAAVIVAAALGWFLKPQPVPSVPLRLQVTLAPGNQLDTRAKNLALSPDGRTLAYVAVRENVSRLYVRPLGAFEATPLEGTEGASNPFFSPDGRWLGFFTQGKMKGKMKKIPVAGGAAETLADAAGNGGASWGADGTIVFAPSITGHAVLWRVSANGGTPMVLTRLDRAKGEYSHRYPQILPGGKIVLFTSLSGFGWDESNVEALMLGTGERRVLVRGGNTGRYVPGGHLLYFRAGALFEIAFDPNRVQVGNDKPAAIADGVRENDGPHGALYAVSGTGTIAYVPTLGGSRQFDRQLVWIDRQGRTEPIEAPSRNYHSYLALSPDGRYVALSIISGTEDLWLYDLKRDSLTRLTSGPASSLTPVWSPDGRHIAYRNNATGTWKLYSRLVDGSAPPMGPLIASDEADWPASWSPDGGVLAFVRASDTTSDDIWMLPLDGDHQPRPFLRTPADESGARFSPDGHWLAYTSVDSEGPQVYVVPYPGPGQRIQVSTEGGHAPQWNPKGGELFYRNGNQTMVVKVITGANFSTDRPKLLYEGRAGAVAPDGQRFLAVMAPDSSGAPLEINMMMNVLKNRAHVGKN
jgi:Tol biopolymer transport system component